MRCERGHSITFRDRGPGRIHMANQGKPMKSCRVQFVVRNRDTKDKTLQINSVECKISDTTRITEQIGKMPQIAETKTVSAIFVMPLSGKITHIVRFSSEQIVNSPRREQFCSRFQIAICNCLIFCVFLRCAVHKVGLSYASAGSEPHF